MSIVEAAMGVVKPKRKLPEAIPPEIEDRLQRGRAAMLKDAALRRCCQKFWEGQHYWYVTEKKTLAVLPSAVIAVEAGKPLHRIRNTYNFAGSIIEGKVSASTQKVPGYEITPSTDDYEDEAAATLAAQVAAYGYDEWKLRRHTTKAFTNAFVQREGFCMPYWDPEVGPFTFDEGTQKQKGKGELKVLNLSRSEVMWEPGVDFDDSRWHAIERAQTPEDVRGIPGYVGGSLMADARTADLPQGKTSDTMIRTTQYLERPSAKYPEGRCCWIANNRIIVDYRKADELAEDWYEPYPCMDADGEVSDEPVLHRISYTVNAEGDDMGLMERLIDLSRTIDDGWNKILEYKNRCLMPQWMAPNGSQMEPKNDIPGYTYRYNLIGGKAPEMVPTQPLPIQDLLTIVETAITHLRALAADVDVQPDPRLTTGTANAAIQSSQSRWQSFLGDAAEFHSRLMRHCLSIVAREYDEARQIDIRGQYGWQPLPAFTGQALRSQVNVRVNPGSLESKSREAIQAELQFIQANWPGAITAEAALGQLHGGSADGLLRSYQNHVAKAHRIVKRLEREDGLATFGTHFDPTVPNLTTGQMGDDVPNWMPEEWDNVEIWRKVFADHMTTESFENSGEHIQQNFRLVWDGLAHTEEIRAAKQAAQQQMQAEASGMGNAAKPQNIPPPLPDRAGFNPDTNQSPVPTP